MRHKSVVENEWLSLSDSATAFQLVQCLDEKSRVHPLLAKKSTEKESNANVKPFSKCEKVLSQLH